MTKHLEIVDPYRTSVAEQPPLRHVLCVDCRFSGWLRRSDYQIHSVPSHCLLKDNGGNWATGERIVEMPRHTLDAPLSKWLKEYPRTWDRNKHGECRDFHPVTPMPWWRRLFRIRSRRRIRT